MQASEVMTRNVITVTPKTEIREIVDLMVTNRVSAIPVIDASERVVGIVSEGDLMRRIENETDKRDSSWLQALFSERTDTNAYIKTHGRKAEDVMTRDVITVAEDTPLYRVAQTLEKNRIKRVPVARDGRLVGIVSRSNLLQGFSTIQAGDSPAGTADDHGIREHIVREISKRFNISGNTTNVVVSNGVVDLWGLVDSESEKKAAAVLAENTPGVKEVRNHFVVAPARTGR